MTAATETTVTIRELPPDEWDRLRAMPFGSQGLPDPQLAKVLVAEDEDGEIVGIWAAMTVVMLDGLWIKPTHRRVTWLAMKLLRAMRTLLVGLGVRQSFTIASTSDVLVLALKAGFTRVQGDLCHLDLSAVIDHGEPPCQ